MFESVSLSTQARVFQCPNCKETIDTSAQQCRFCSAAIDPGAAEAAADIMARVNQACSDASYLKVMGVSVPVFLVLIFVPFAGWLGIVGYYFLVFATPAMAIRWWVRFGRIKTDDREFGSAKRTVIIVGALVSLLLLNQLANFALMFVRTLR
ncbi:MAG: hypothetical protein ABSE55_12310 [Terracidiphilus sp.]|jgi:hypothetical protein